MNRNKSLAAALSVAFISASGAASAAQPPSLLGLPINVDLPIPLPGPLGSVTDALKSIGLNVDQIADITKFLSLDREAQHKLLVEDEQLDDPGGPLSDSYVGDYILGQYMLKHGIAPAKAIHLQLLTGKADPNRALELIRSLAPTDIIVTDDEINQQILAKNELKKTPEVAKLRAQLQKLAMMLRPYLGRLLPDLGSLWIEDAKAGPHLVLSLPPAASPIVADVLGKDKAIVLAGVTVEVRYNVRVGKKKLEDEMRGVRALLDEKGIPATVAADPTSAVTYITPLDERGRGDADAIAALAGQKARKEVVIKGPKQIGSQSFVGGHIIDQQGCTWGFSVMVGNVPGTTTAAHCVPASGVLPPYYYYGTFGMGRTASLKQGKVDAARHTSDPAVNNQYDNFIDRGSAAGGLLEITAKNTWGNTSIGDVACHVGVGSGGGLPAQSCGWVTYDNVSPSWVTNSLEFIQVESPSLKQWPGDSGGPWFYGNTAFGIHSGGYNNLNPNNSNWGLGIYGSIDYAEQNTGFLVMVK
jgi:hypothetical protein